VTAPVFVADPDAFASGSSVVLHGAEARHAATVRRLRVGESIVVTDGLGQAVFGEVATVTRDGVEVTVSERLVQDPADPRLTVVQAIPKGDRAERAVELLTEVGVDEIVPFAAARCVSRWPADRTERALARWRSAAREAGKQARRWRFPVVTEPAVLEAVAHRVTRSALALILHESAGTSLGSVALPTAGEITLVVGPEGGLTDDEVSRLVAAGAVAVRLGPTVMRTSTAGVVAAAAILARTTRWDVSP